MAHFAKIENNLVTEVLVVNNDLEHRGADFLVNDLGLGGTWIKTSYNTRGNVHVNGGIPFRKNYAGIGFSYDSNRDAFISPKPFDSWLLNEDSCLWEAPVAYPNDGNFYTWDEETLSWKEVAIDE